MGYIARFMACVLYSLGWDPVSVSVPSHVYLDPCGGIVLDVPCTIVYCRDVSNKIWFLGFPLDSPVSLCCYFGYFVAALESTVLC